MNGYNVISFAGLFLLLGLGWALSNGRSSIRWRTVGSGLGIQLVLGIFVFLIPFGSNALLLLSDLVVRMLGAANAGIIFLFGSLAIPPGEEGSVGFILLVQALPVIVFVAALMEILYFIGFMPLLIRGCARFFSRCMGTSGAESLCAASNIFVGIESATTVLPYLGRMTRSELCTVLTAGMATVASSVLALYVLFLQSTLPNIAAHLISASLLSAPAALVMSKLLLPEREQPETLGKEAKPHYERPANLMDAAMRGAGTGGKLVMGIVVMLLAFLGLVELINLGFDGISAMLTHWTGKPIAFRLEDVLAVVFYPPALLIGVPISDAFEVARLLGQRAVLTEVPAYQALSDLLANGTLEHPRSAVIASYALCGFAHVPALAIFVGGIAALVPERQATLASVAFRALVAATLACLMTAAVAGAFYGQGALLFEDGGGKQVSSQLDS